MATIPTFPSIDLSKLSLSNLPKFAMPKFEMPKFATPGMPTFDASKLDLSKLDLSGVSVAGIDAERIVTVLRDAVYVAIGFGVLTIQQLQVRRRELADSLGSNPVAKQLGLSKEQLDEIVRGVEARMGSLDGRLDAIETKIDAAVAQLETRLPEQAGAVLGQAHDLAKAARKQVRGLIRNAA